MGVGPQVVLTLAADPLQGGDAGDGELGPAQGLEQQGQQRGQHHRVVRQPLGQGAWGQGQPGQGGAGLYLHTLHHVCGLVLGSRLDRS